MRVHLERRGSSPVMCATSLSAPKSLRTASGAGAHKVRCAARARSAARPRSPQRAAAPRTCAAERPVHCATAFSRYVSATPAPPRLTLVYLLVHRFVCPKRRRRRTRERKGNQTDRRRDALRIERSALKFSLQRRLLFCMAGLV